MPDVKLMIDERQVPLLSPLVHLLQQGFQLPAPVCGAYPNLYLLFVEPTQEDLGSKYLHLSRVLAHRFLRAVKVDH